jgi:hypothetical protein
VNVSVIEIKNAGWKMVAALAAFTLIAACNSGQGPTGPVDGATQSGARYGNPTQPVAGDPSLPVISSFYASAKAITQGGSTKLNWKVSGADKVSIQPFPGTVNGNGVSVSPLMSTTFTISATAGGQTVSKQLVVQVLSGAGNWNVKEKPPAMTGARRVDVTKISPTRIDAQSINCGGMIRQIRLSDTEDAVVYMSGNKALRYPLRVTGGRNVRVVGLAFALETQPGCGVGELPNFPTAKHPNANIHPRIPGGIALRLQQANTSFVEGLSIDLRGHEADCIVTRNPDQMSGKQAQKQRDVVIQNTFCSGIEGLGNSRIGSGIHGDFFQNQGDDVMRRLVFENVSVRSSQEGIVLHGAGSLPGSTSLLVRRYDYTWDPRYVGDDSYEHFGLAFDGQPNSNWTLEDIRLDDYRNGGDYIMIKGQRYGNSPAGNVMPHSEIISGLPAEGAFAPAGQTGINYLSPHGGNPVH